MKNKIIYAVALILAVIAAFSLASCKRRTVKGKELFYFMHSSGGIEENTLELILKDSGGKLFVELHSGENEDRVYEVPADTFKRLTDVVYEYGMESWNESSYVGIDGAVTEIRFTDENGKVITASAAKMPDNGKEAFNRLEEILLAYSE